MISGFIRGRERESVFSAHEEHREKVAVYSQGQGSHQQPTLLAS